MTVLVLEGLIEIVTFEGAAASEEYLGKGERGWRLVIVYCWLPIFQIYLHMARV